MPLPAMSLRSLPEYENRAAYGYGEVKIHPEQNCRTV